MAFAAASQPNGAARQASAPTSMPHFGQGAGLARLHEFAEAMGDGPQRDTSEHWRVFTEEFFAREASMHLVLWNPTSRERKAFELPISVVPRWFHTNYTSGVRSMSFYFENPREYMAGSGFPPIPRIYKMDLNLPSNRVTHFVECRRAMLVLRFETGWQVQMTGLLRAAFVPTVQPASTADSKASASSTSLRTQLKLEGLDYIVNHHASFITRHAITNVDSPERIPLQLVRRIAAKGEAGSEATVKEEASPGENAATTGSADAELSDYKMNVTRAKIPECPVNEYGITLRAMRCLEITESVCQLRDLMDFTWDDNERTDRGASHLSAIDGLRKLAARYRETEPYASLLQQRGNGDARVNGSGGSGGPGSPRSANGAPSTTGSSIGAKRKSTVNQSPSGTPRTVASPGTPNKRVR